MSKIDNNEVLKEKIDLLKDENALEMIRERSKEYITLMTYYRCAIMEIETKLNVLNEEYSLQHDRNPINSIKSRLKSPQSIIDKMTKRALPMSISSLEENINDIAGLRVICSFPEDVYVICDALLSQDDVTLIEIKDYIKNPKPNGYRSLHIIVSIPIFLAKEKRMMKVEVQLRTIAMDCWASLEHQLRYKKEISQCAEIEKELKKCAQISKELDTRMDNLRKRILEG